jgi:hypothetical protein
VSSQNLICEPSFILKVSHLKKFSLTFNKPFQKCKSPNLPKVFFYDDSVLIKRYVK